MCPVTMDKAPVDMTPRTAAFIAALHATKGDREAAGLWMIELISWIVFQQGRAAQAASLPARPQEAAPAALQR